jgi:hypothetical protein
MICFWAQDKKAQNLTWMVADVCTGRVQCERFFRQHETGVSKEWRHSNRNTRGHDEFAVYMFPEGGYSNRQWITNICVQKLKLDLPKLFP